MKALVYSHLISNRSDRNYAPGTVDAMLDLWLRSLRGPGRFTGDILLFTDREDLRAPQIIVRPIRLQWAQDKELWTARIANYERLPYRDYDTIMHLDLDTICVNDITDLFATDDTLRAAPSNLLLFEPKHIRQFLNPAQKIWYGRFSPRRSQKGVSASIFSCAASAWEHNMGTWARTIAQHRHAPVPELGDQSYLNLLYFRKAIPIRPYSYEEIQHRDWSYSPHARIFHFPGRPDRVELMHRHSRDVGSSEPA